MLLQGCYLLKQGSYLLRYTRMAVDNQELIQSRQTPEATRAFLLQTEDISAYARETLGLERNKNYSRYADIGRAFLAWVVSGTEEYSFTPYQWSYPLIGKAPYKGFYEEADARKEAEKLQKKGYDVWVRKVGAFSTLGYLTDPLYSYMRDYPAYRIANLIIHEQAHATLYLKGQGHFNESFATFVGDTGAKNYIAQRFGFASEEYTSIFTAEADGETFRREIEKLRSDLEGVYRHPSPDMEERKINRINAFKSYIQDEYDSLFRTEAYRRIGELPINNAYLSLYGLYNTDLHLFEEVHERYGGDLRKTVEAIKTAAAGTEDGFAALRELLNTPTD